VSNPARDAQADGAAPSPGHRRHLRLLGRASWNLVDQMLSAVTNVALAVLIVQAGGKKAWDSFSVAFLLFAIMIGIERALVGQPLGIRHSADTGAQRRRTASRALGVTVGITVPAAVAMLGAGLVMGGRLGTTLVATAVVLPFLILQDTCRQAFFAWGQASKAAFTDALWAVVQFSAMGLLMAAHSATAPRLVLAWGGGAAVCVVVAMVQLRAVPDPRATLGWVREHRDMVGYFVGEYMLTTGAFNGGYLTVGAIVGEHAVGSIRAVQVLLGPLQIVSSAALSFGLPELSRRAEHLTRGARRKIAYATSGGMVVLSVTYLGVLHLLPDAFGRLLFRDAWAEARPVLLPLGLAMVASTATLGPAVIIYALGLAKRTFRLITIEAPLVFTFMIGGTLLFGVQGAAWGQFADQAIILFLWFTTLRAVLAGGSGDGGSTASRPEMPPGGGLVLEPFTGPIDLRA
jgi:O-antigen/teichoic acid export membrane protein